MSRDDKVRYTGERPERPVKRPQGKEWKLSFDGIKKQEEGQNERRAGGLLDPGKVKPAPRPGMGRPEGGQSYEEYKAQRDAMMSGRNYVKWISIPVSLGFIALVCYGAYYMLFYFEEPGHVHIESAAIYYPVFKWDKDDVYTALHIIQKTSPRQYYLVDTYVDRIIIYPAYGYKYGKFSPKDDYREKSIYVMKSFPCPTDCDGQYTGEDLIRAAVIIHEACHAMQYNTGKEISEGECRKIGYDFVTTIGPFLLPGYNQSKYEFLGREGPYTELIKGEYVSDIMG